MILIFSNESDGSTDIIIDYLIYKKASFIRINSNDLLKGNLFIDINKKIICINDRQISIDKINVIWHRRWFNFDLDIYITKKNECLRNSILSIEKHELQILSEYLFLLLNNKRKLTDYFSNKNHNKLYTLTKAEQVGLDIPKTFITNSNHVLKNKMKLISKPIGDFLFLENKNKIYKSFTTEIDINNIIKREMFFPSLFQEKINCEHEIRTFFLDGDFYSTAIMNYDTIDIKQSVSFNENVRYEPFQLPEEIELKLNLLMKNLNLNTGSIDLIKTIENKYYFLEVNPVGQFLGYGFFVNYNLEEKVSEWLIKNDY